MTIRTILKKVISFALRQKMHFILISKIKGILKEAAGHAVIWKPSPAEKMDHRKLWDAYCRNVNISWLRVYGTISGIRSVSYVPEYVYYSELEPRLNNRAFSKAYTDKNFYNRFLDPGILPEVVLHAINGVYYDSGYSNIEGSPGSGTWSEKIADGKYIIKPTIDSGGGSGIRTFEISRGSFSLYPSLSNVSSVPDLVRFYKRDFVIQKYIEQHKFFSQFNQDSLNTIRILTYRSLADEKVHILHRILRMGRAGSIVDNQASGGIACGISREGLLSDFGVDKHGIRHEASNGIVFSSIGKVPFLDIISEMALGVARKFFYSRLLGMDFGVDRAGKVILIEINDSNNEINFYQMNNGPLFGEHTGEVAGLSIMEPKTVLLDYNLE